LGNSEKFILVAKKLWPNDNISVVPWRAIRGGVKSTGYYQLVLVCGYDYESYKKGVKEYIESNVIEPLSFLEGIENKDVDIIYIMTELPKSKYTFSRYLYAKYLLALNLLSSKLNVFILPIPTIVDENGKANSFKPSSPFLVGFLKKCKLLKCIEMEDLLKLVNNYKINRIEKLSTCKPIGISAPRNISIDRVMRLILG
jgi:hypothetical protein